MTYRLERTQEVEADLKAVASHLIESQIEFGEPLEDARENAAKRLNEIAAAFAALSRAPFQGTLRGELGPGVRNVTKNRAIIYFTVDEAAKTVRVIGVFWGGQNHGARMRQRTTK
jgi:toxin ParE1/3/4